MHQKIKEDDKKYRKVVDRKKLTKDKQDFNDNVIVLEKSMKHWLKNHVKKEV